VGKFGPATVTPAELLAACTSISAV
jgi:hypothetical protein